MTGSRLLFWLHALTSALSDSGYWSGVVICFSMRQPITRASIGESSMFMGRKYHKLELGAPCFEGSNIIGILGGPEPGGGLQAGTGQEAGLANKDGQPGRVGGCRAPANPRGSQKRQDNGGPVCVFTRKPQAPSGARGP